MHGKKLVAASLLLVLACGAGVAWMERTRLQSWYYLRGLSQSTQFDRATWINRLTVLGEPAVDGLLEQLSGDEPHAGKRLVGPGSSRPHLGQQRSAHH